MEAVSLPNNGIVLSEVDENLMKIIGDEVEKIQKDFSKAVPNNKTLVGNIVHEYQIFDCKDVLEKN